MADLWDAEKRSWVMSRIRSRDTKPEIVRSILHRLGYRFTVSGPLNKSLPGKPDIVLPKWKTVVLVHGCFWQRQLQRLPPPQNPHRVVAGEAGQKQKTRCPREEGTPQGRLESDHRLGLRNENDP